jgi:hypothetical protein
MRLDARVVPRWRSFAVAAAVVLLLAGLPIAVYFDLKERTVHCGGRRAT